MLTHHILTIPTTIWHRHLLHHLHLLCHFGSPVRFGIRVGIAVVAIKVAAVQLRWIHLCIVVPCSIVTPIDRAIGVLLRLITSVNLSFVTPGP
jgi:hypothetical protein